MLRGGAAGLLALLLVCGMGTARSIAGAHGADAAYDDLTIITQSDTASDDLAAASPVGNDGPDDDQPFYGATAVLAVIASPSVSAEDQVAFGLRRSTIKRALHPTGPPLLS